MKINKEGLEIIKEREGFRKEPYFCSANVLTVGYGHAILKDDVIDGLKISIGSDGKVKAKGSITRTTGDLLLNKDILKFEKGVSNVVTYPANENQFSALVSFAFNVGLTNLKNSTLLKYHNMGEFAMASFEFPKWNKVTKWDDVAKKNVKEVEQGLVTRRRMEQQLYMKD